MASISSSEPASSPKSRFAPLTATGDLPACLLLVLLVAVHARPVLLGELPNSTDFILQYYPNLAFLAASLRQGEIPLWNPYLFAGTPYLADPQTGALYIPNYPFLLLLDTASAARAIIFSHLVLAALSMYLHVRTLGLGTKPAFLGAAVFGLGQYTMAQVAGIPMLISLAWMPAALAFAAPTVRRGSFQLAALGGVSLAIQFLNGWPHGVYMTGLALLVIIGGHAAAQAVRARSWMAVRAAVALGAVVAGTAIGLAAPVWIPFLEFWGKSNYAMARAVGGDGREGSVTPLVLLGASGAEGHAAYLGAIGLLLALLGSARVLDKPPARTYLLLAVAALLVSLGTSTPVYALLHDWLPGFQAFQVPGRFMALFVFSSSVLAALGADTVRDLGTRRPRTLILVTTLIGLGGFLFAVFQTLGAEAPRLLAKNLLYPSEGPFLGPTVAQHVALALAGAGLFIAAVLSGRIRGNLAYYLTLAILLPDLLLFAGKDAYYFSRPTAVLRAQSPATAIEGLAREEQGFRVAGFQRMGNSHFMSDFPFNLNAALVPPNFAMMYGLEDLQGYLPLRLRRYADYMAAVNGGHEDYHWALIDNFNSRLLDMLSLKYVLLRADESRLRNVTLASNVVLAQKDEAVSVRSQPVLSGAVQVHSYLGNAVDLRDGEVVARLRIKEAGGGEEVFEIRAGVESAEWAYDRPDVTARVKHNKPPVSVKRNLPSPTNTYVAELRFPKPVMISEVGLERILPGVQVSVPELVAVPAQPIERYERVGDLDGATLYRNNFALPRVMLVPRATMVPDAQTALRRLLADDFDPRREVVLEGVGPTSQSRAEDVSMGEVAIASRGNSYVKLQVNVNSPGFVVLNELSYVGWKAYLDGEPAPVLRANYLFRAVEVPTGKHEVDFRFELDSLRLGLLPFLFTVLLLFAAGFVARVSQHHRKGYTAP